LENLNFIYDLVWEEIGITRYTDIISGDP